MPGLKLMSAKKARTVLVYFTAAVVISIALLLTWLSWESARPRDKWFGDRQGQIDTVVVEESSLEEGQLSETVSLKSDSGLEVSFRVVREASASAVPVLLVLGGHQTGSDAVDLFGDVGHRAVVGMDYPYDEPDEANGVLRIARTIPRARRAILDTVPSVSLIMDWLVKEAWVDRDKIVIVGASLGVPFAAAAAARDPRITGVMLVHGAVDIRLWLQVQVARRIEAQFLHYPLAKILYWLAYGPVFDTSKHIAAVSPRPVLIVGARDDERTPAGQAEALFDSAGKPKRLRYTEGQHVQPDRNTIVAELFRIADEEMPFLTQ